MRSSSVKASARSRSPGAVAVWARRTWRMRVAARVAASVASRTAILAAVGSPLRGVAIGSLSVMYWLVAGQCRARSGRPAERQYKYESLKMLLSLLHGWAFQRARLICAL